MTTETKPRIDKEIGKQKFKAKREYTITVEFEGEAYTREDFENMIPISVDLKNYDEWDSEKDSTIELTSEKCYEHSEWDHDKKTYTHERSVEKIAECVPNEDVDEDGNDFLDYECGTWETSDFEWRKNEDGTDKKNDT